MDTADLEVIAKVYSLLLINGAISTERLVTLSKRPEREVLWATYQLKADKSKGSELWSLNQAMLPVNY